MVWANGECVPVVDLLPWRQRRKKRWERYADALTVSLEDLSEQQREIVRLRWFDEANRYDVLWRQQRFIHYWFRVPIIAGSATVPVLASLSAAKIATVLVGLVVAILSGIDSFFHLGLRWQQQRRAGTTINFEGWQFIELSGEYQGKSHVSQYETFLGRIEALNQRLSTKYLDIFSDDTGSLPGQRGGTQQADRPSPGHS
jgi:hypothetical protein